MDSIFQDKCVIYGLHDMSPYDDPMRQELLSGKFTVLVRTTFQEANLNLEAHIFNLSLLIFNNTKRIRSQAFSK